MQTFLLASDVKRYRQSFIPPFKVAVVVDLETGEEKARCKLGTHISANMLRGAGHHRDAYAGGGLESSLIRIFVKGK